jgi:hypothetical protein
MTHIIDDNDDLGSEQKFIKGLIYYLSCACKKLSKDTMKSIEFFEKDKLNLLEWYGRYLIDRYIQFIMNEFNPEVITMANRYYENNVKFSIEEELKRIGITVETYRNHGDLLKIFFKNEEEKVINSYFYL